MGDKDNKDTKKKVAVRNGSSAKAMQEDEAKCGRCGRQVLEKETDQGIQCEICNDWFH